MGVFASGTDKKDILERAKDSGWNAAIILNKKGHIFGHIADLELGVYLEDVPVEIEYPFSDEEFDNKLLEEIKKVDNLKDARTLLRFTDEEFFDMNNPLSQEDKDFLDSVIKDRFKNAKTTTYTSSKDDAKKKNGGDGNGTKTNGLIKTVDTSARTFIDELEVNGVEEIAEDASDFFTEEELEIIYAALEKPQTQLTDTEWRLLVDYDYYYNNGALGYAF